VPQFLSPAWVERCNEVLAGLAPDPEHSIVAASGTFRVEQLISGAPPDGRTVRTVLTSEQGALSVALDPDPAPEANVVMEIAYPDAAALAKGELDAASALGEGKVRVHGDLAVLVSAQLLLQAAAGRLAAVQAETTY
jgi:hypothetical protein